VSAGEPVGAGPSSWYRHFWPWFIVGLVGSAVVASLVTVWIAVANPDSLVSDDWYEDGTTINRRLERSEVARRLGVGATLRFAVDSREIELTLRGREIGAVEWLRLEMHHPTNAQRDRVVLLRRDTRGLFRGRVEESLSGRWYASLEPAEGSAGERQEPGWRITETLMLPASDPVSLGDEA